MMHPANILHRVAENTTGAWWQLAVIYQIYPRSFQSTDGSGVGTLKGIAERLDYLSWLGVDAVWISPFFPSPMQDFGYDVSDYCNVDPMFGDLDDFDALIRAAHKQGIKVILDFVPNHTSNEHPWFLESRASRTNSKRTWYLWRDPAPGGGPPNNWQSVTGGPAWTFDEATEQYFLHSFLPCQPDLNWRNPAVQEAMLDVLRFWLKRGVDGFRIDMIEFLVKDDHFRDDPPNPHFVLDPTKPWYSTWYSLEHRFSSNQPETHELVRRMRRVLDAYGDRVAIGEIDLHQPLATRMAFYGAGDELHLPFNFELIALPWEPRAIASFVERYEASLPPGAWPNYNLSNHDVPRIATRLGTAHVRLAAMLLLTLRGTPFLYYGEELGLSNVPVPTELARDPWEARQPGGGRDPERTPMQWDASAHAGFSTGAPWLPVSADFRGRNVAVQRQDPTSVLNLYRALISLRRQTPPLTRGTYHGLSAPSDDLLVFKRRADGRAVTAILNFSAEPRQVALPRAVDLLLSTELDRQGATGQEIALRPFEGVLLSGRETS